VGAAPDPGEHSGASPTARYTHQQLGSMIGSNREAVTRALKRLREEGGVEVRRRQIHILDLEALKRIAEEPTSRKTVNRQRSGRRRGVKTE
jgi:DNA-binding transcriptional regulator YhcF (GntR family)